MKFNDFGFKKFINDGLEAKNFIEPTSVQQEVIPYFKKHQNIIVQSQTGTGKTYAFLLPILNNLNYDGENEVQALIIAPTRELAKQIYDEINYFKKFNSLINAGLFIGGEDNLKIEQNLEKKQPLIAVGTPQKIRELYDQNLLKVTTAKWVVVDEFDMIFDLGFFDDLDYLMLKINDNSVKALFSATFDNKLKIFVKKYIPNSIEIDQVEKQIHKASIEHILIDTKNRDDKIVLQALVKSINPYIALVFVNSKDQVKEVVNWLREFGINDIGEMHGDLLPRARTAMLKKIKNNEFKYIVATDIAARGIDIIGVSHVISIDLPKDLNYYVHRAGRTGRNNFTGKSYVLFNVSNEEKIRYLQKKGINFEYAKLLNGQIQIQDEIKAKPKLKRTNEDEQKIIGKYRDKKVKPGYKKKRKQEIQKMNQKKRRQHIKENIEKIKKDRYKQRQKEVFQNND